jgi:hypothetical protein
MTLLLSLLLFSRLSLDLSKFCHHMRSSYALVLLLLLRRRVADLNEFEHHRFAFLVGHYRFDVLLEMIVWSPVVRGSLSTVLVDMKLLFYMETP